MQSVLISEGQDRLSSRKISRSIRLERAVSTAVPVLRLREDRQRAPLCCELPNKRSIVLSRSRIDDFHFQIHPSFPSDAFPFDYNTSHDSNLVIIGTLSRDGAGNCTGVDVMRIRNPWEGTTVAEFVEGIGEQVSCLLTVFLDFSR